MSLKSFLLGAGLLLCCSGTAVAQSWTLDNPGRQAYVISNDGRTSLAVECVQGDFWLRHNIDPSQTRWGRLTQVMLTIDDQSYSMMIDGGSDYFLMSSPELDIGINHAVIDALKHGSSVEISNPASETVPLSSRSYGLRGSNAALTNLQASCLPPPPPEKFSGFLDPDALRQTVVGKRIRHNSLQYPSSVEFEFRPDGTYWTNGGSATGNSIGQYELEEGGCIRWNSAFGTTGCFKMRFDGDKLMVHPAEGSAMAIVEFL